MTAPSVASVGATGTSAPAVPSGVTAGSLVIVLASAVWTGTSSHAGGISVSGFTAGPRIGSAAYGAYWGELGLFYKYATGSDSGTYTVAASGGTLDGAVAARISGGPTSGNPFVDTSYTNTGTASAVSIASFTPTTGDDLIVGASYIFGASGQATTIPSGWTAEANWGTSNSQRVTLSVLSQSTAAATGTLTWTNTYGNAVSLALAVTVRPGPSFISGTLSASVPVLTASLGGGTVAATLSGSTPKLAGSVTGRNIYPYPYVTGVDPTASRTFVDQDGSPILPSVDHQWHMIAWGGGRSELSPGTTTPLLVFQAYAAEQASNGFNGVLVMAICSDQGGPVGPYTDGRTWDGVAPWGAGGIGDLNSSYWSRVDDMVDAMAAQGITVWLNIIASYTIASGTALAGITTTNAATYGAALAARYSGRPNIVWHFGADYFASKEAEFAAIITALRAGGDTHMAVVEYMAESDSRKTSSNATTGTFGNSTAVAFDDIYTYNAAYLEVERSYALTSPATRPALYFNGRYDQQTTAYDTVLLDDILWALTSGSAGHYYGSEATWKWESGSWAHIFADTLPTVWLKKMRTFWTGLTGWSSLVPDISSTFITSSRGTKVTALASGGGATAYTGGNTYVTGGVTADGTLAVLYTPTSRTITIDGTKLTPTYTATWVDPYSFATTSATSSATTYTTPSSNSAGDGRWLLVLKGAPSNPGTLAGAVPKVTGSVTGVATNTGTLAASLLLIAGAITGISVNGGTLNGDTLIVAGSVTGQSINPGTLAGSLPVITGSDNGTQANPGTLSGNVPLLTGALADVPTLTGALSGKVPALTGSVTGTQTNPGTLAGTVPRPTSSITGTATNPGAVSGAVPRLTGSLPDNSSNPGTVNATVPLLTGSMTGTMVNAGIIAGNLPKVTGSLSGTVVNPAVLTGLVPLLAGFIADSPKNSGTLTAKVPLLTASVVGSQVSTGILAGTLPLLTGVITDIPLRPDPGRTLHVPPESRTLEVHSP